MLIIILAAVTLVSSVVSPLLFQRRIPVSTLCIPDRRARCIAAALPWALAVVCASAAGAAWFVQSVPLAAMAALCATVPAIIALTVASGPPRIPASVQDLQDAVAGLDAPSIAFHFSDAGLETPTHVDMWIDALDASGVSWYVICREKRHHDWFRKTGRAKSVHAADRSALRWAVAPGVRAILYANNAQKNREMLEEREDLVHVQMLHGDSDKPPSYSPLTRNFDQVFVSGQMGEDRYARNGVFIPPSKFVHVGRPQSALMQRGKRGPVKTAVYMPTWLGQYEDTKFSSLERAAEIIERFGECAPGVTLIFKPHPLSFKHPSWPRIEKDVRAALRKFGGEFAAPDLTAFEAYEMADVLLTDISSTVIDFLFTDRPQILFLPEGFELDELRYPSLAAAGQVDPDLSNLDAKIFDAIGPDRLAKARKEMREYAFGADAGSEDSRFSEAIRALACAPSMAILSESDLDQETLKEAHRCSTPKRKAASRWQKAKNQSPAAKSARLIRLRAKRRGAV